MVIKCWESLRVWSDSTNWQNSEWKFRLPPFLWQGEMIARVEGSFSSLPPSLFPSISFFLPSFLFLFKMSKNGNSVLKSYFLSLNSFFSLHFCLFITPFPLFLSLVFFSQSLWTSSCDFLSPVAGRAAQVQHAPRREVRPVGPTCRAERKGGEAQGS